MTKPIKIVTICGSVRPKNYTSMALALVLSEFAKQTDVEVEAIDLTAVRPSFPWHGAAGYFQRAFPGIRQKCYRGCPGNARVSRELQ